MIENLIIQLGLIPDIADLLRRMGYPRLISQTSFRSPNFLLVADILKWFLRRFDSSVDMLSDLSTETQRVNFIRSFVHHMVRFFESPSH